jgi:methylglutaconyl-CoA hydratase
MSYQAITLASTGGIAHIDLNRPDLRNAFNEIMIAELTEAFLHCSTAADVRVVILGGQGKSFCAGADLNWMRRMAGFSDAENRADALALASMLQTLYTLPKPVVARVHGDCYAGGMGLVAACDIAVAATGAGFCLSETRLGLIPATISPYLIESIGASAARRYFLTAERFTALEAKRIGLVHEVAEAEELDATLAPLIASLMNNSPHAMGEAKRLVRDLVARRIDASLVADTAERIAMVRSSVEGREGVSAFLEKRSPSWLPAPRREDS